MVKRPSSGRPQMATSEGNVEMIEDLIGSQEENPRAHKLPREIEKYNEISHSSVKWMVKRKGLKILKLLEMPRMSEDLKKWKTERAVVLVERFS